MARMPGAIWKPLAADWASQPRMRAYDFFCLHTMVGGLDGTDGYFRNKNGIGYGGTESHFGVGPDGTIYQWQDTAFQADANGNGNWHVISSENADTGAPFPKWGGSDVPAFTPQQIEANARIAAWLNEVHGIPLDLVPDSRPGRRGLAVHRWGVPGYMVSGAEQWSTSQGKACPGDRRIAQAPQVSARAKQIRGGTPATPEPGDPDMRVLRTPDGTIWLATDTEVTATGSLGLANSAGKAWGGAIACTREEVQELINDAEARRVRRVEEIQRAVLCAVPKGEAGAWLWHQVAAIEDKTGAPSDVDEEALAAALAPKLNGASQGEIAAAMREVLTEGVGS